MSSRKSRPIAEHEAHGDTARIYHEIRQTLRVSGVNLNFRTWATFPHFFSAMWLCVINTVCYDSWPIELMLQFGHPLANRRLSAAMAVRLLKQALKGGFAKRPPAALLDGLLAPYSTEVGKLSLIRNAAALNTNLTTEIAPLLPSIRVPTLILWGEDDLFQPVAYGERLAWDIPGAQLVRISGARHFAMVDRPRQIAAQLSAFVSQR